MKTLLTRILALFTLNAASAEEPPKWRSLKCASAVGTTALDTLEFATACNPLTGKLETIKNWGEATAGHAQAGAALVDSCSSAKQTCQMNDVLSKACGLSALRCGAATVDYADSWASVI